MLIILHHVHRCLAMCVHPAKLLLSIRGRREARKWGRVTLSSILPRAHLHRPPASSTTHQVALQTGVGEKAASDLWGMSVSSTTQAAPSWVDLGDVFNVASRIPKPFTERIYSSCCSQDSFNSRLEFYLFPWTCQVSCGIEKEAPTEVSCKWYRRSLCDFLLWYGRPRSQRDQDTEHNTYLTLSYTAGLSSPP